MQKHWHIAKPCMLYTGLQPLVQPALKGFPHNHTSAGISDFFSISAVLAIDQMASFAFVGVATPGALL
ncbi:hypothetical protein Y1Q_0003015 [Alligator mississippiensis]|uniref:Uncharacterized protein n=1 Tax=Alligator mississippiensis TaxID=8496 RepID=A0A151MD32_ALLMI|nr:hypothetical protein Y1Q_0003015 [Alligator mississippiensis]